METVVAEVAVAVRKYVLFVMMVMEIVVVVVVPVAA
jgi:hypothetical protein